MSVVGGLSGLVNSGGSAISGVGKWSIDYNGEPVSFVASNTKGGTVRLAGNQDWSGTYKGLGATPAVKPGDFFQFQGSIDGTNGVESEASGTIVDGIVVDWDIEGAGVITHDVTFSSSSALTLGAITTADDTVVPIEDLSSIIALPLKLSDHLVTPSFDAVTDVRTMQLSISRNNPSYVSSTTAGQTKRVAGPWDAEFTYSVYEGDPANLLVPGTVKQVQAYINATHFWAINTMICSEVTGIETDMESGAIVGATQVFKFQAFALDDVSIKEGFIKTPSDSPVTWWPES